MGICASDEAESYDVDTDDVKVEFTKEKKEVAKKPAAKPAAPEPVESVALKAVRMKRREDIFTASVNLDEKYEPPVLEKDEETSKQLTAALQGHFLFTQVDDKDIQTVVLAMEKEVYQPEEVIIQQGDHGEKATTFYVMTSGASSVYVGTNKVFAYEPGGAFGELALLYSCPRQATIKADKPDTTCYRLDNKTFRYILAHTTKKNNDTSRDALMKVPCLKSLDPDQLNKICQAVTVVRFKKGSTIIRKGDVGEAASVFYFLQKGNVIFSDTSDDSDATATLRATDEAPYFGERALMKDEPRACTVTAGSDVTCMALSRDNFNSLLGPLANMMHQEFAIRVVRTVQEFQMLSEAQFKKVVTQFKSVKVKPGQQIIKQGDPGTCMYVIISGSVEVKQNAKDDEGNTIPGKEVSIIVLDAGKYFGQTALLNNEARNSSCYAKSECELFVLKREDFENILGPLQDIIERRVEEQKAMAERKLKQSSTPGEGIKFEDLEQLKTLGTGTFGRVKLVKHKETKETFALKMLQKAQVVAYRQQQNVMNEKEIMAECTHPFILQLFATFKDKNCLYMLLELVLGGELFTLLHCKGQKLEPPGVRFYTACVVDAFAYMHEKTIVYRDLKPENLLLDLQGYIKVVDFGFAKRVPDRTFTLCGTPEYLAPELVLGKGHSKGVDYWAIGILIYEMLYSVSPFADNENSDHMVICRNIVRGDLSFPSTKDATAELLIRGLLVKDVKNRLGCMRLGALDIKRHSYFDGLDWKKLLNREMPEDMIPWIPPVSNALDTSNFDGYEEEVDVEEYVDDGSDWHEGF